MMLDAVWNELPKLADPVSSDEAAGPQEEVAAAVEVEELNVLLHLQMICIFLLTQVSWDFQCASPSAFKK